MATWKSIPSRDDIPSYACFTKTLQKSGLDDRDYRLIRLENGLQAVIVHDDLADKAAACVNVAVGSLQDPDDMFGMAHFCEHMLSKGSIPFPAENDFLSYIITNGGTRNATTRPASTNYWFSIGPNFLDGALARLAAFFHSPLFSPSVTAREINAVDSENKKNLQNDGRRAFQLAKGLSVAGHPWKKFSTGNIESLTEAAKKLETDGHLPFEESETTGDGGPVGRETRRRLVEWWKKEYCAGRMTLAIVGKESLDDMTALAVKYFSPIPNVGLDSRPTVIEPYWGPEEMGSIIYLKTVKDIHALSLTFPLPYQQPHFHHKPAHFISHLLGHEGPGSIYAYLKKQGWIVSLSSGPQRWNRGIQIFEISVTLTTSGLSNYKDVLLAMYGYIKMLRSSQLPAFLHEEVKNLSEMQFRFKEKTEPHTYAVFLAEELTEPYPPEQLLSADTLVQQWDEDLVRQTLSNFDPERGRVMLRAKEHSNIPTNAEWKTERWYGTQYIVKRLDDTIIARIQESIPNAEFFLPKPNQYIPENLEVQARTSSEPARKPNRIRETPLSTLWHKSDDQFEVPKAHANFDIRSPLAYTTPRHAVLTRILADLVEDALAIVTYDAQLAGLHYALTAHSEGILVSFGGFNDKLPLLMRTILSMIKNLEVNPRRLAVITEQLKLKYENFYLGSPHVIAEYKMSTLLMPIIWSPTEELQELLLVTMEDVRQHKEELFSSIRIESLVNGNIEAHIAIGLVSMAEDILATRPLASCEQFSNRSLILPEGCNFVRQEAVVDPKELNSSLVYYCHFGDIADTRLRPILELMVHVMREPCFSQLRTKEQLGYIVSIAQQHGPGSMGLSIRIQSVRDPVYLEQRVDAFLAAFRNQLSSMSVQELESQKAGLIVKKLERLRNLWQESARFWSHISGGYYDFTRHEKDAATVRELTLGEILNAYASFVSPSSRSRRKLSVHLRSQKLEPSSLPFEGTVVVIEDETTFKAALESSVSPVPVEGTPFLDSSDDGSKSRL